MDYFDASENAYTATAGTIVINENDEVNFSKWGNPERTKINQAAPAVNLYASRRWGVW